MYAVGQIGLGMLPEGERSLAETLCWDLELAQHPGQNACHKAGMLWDAPAAVASDGLTKGSTSAAVRAMRCTNL